MERYKKAILDLSDGLEVSGEGSTAQSSGEVAESEGQTRQAASPETEVVSAADNAGLRRELESVKKEDLDMFEQTTETCSGEVTNSNGSVLDLSELAPLPEVEALAAKESSGDGKSCIDPKDVTPSSASLRSPSRSRKQTHPKRFIAEEAAAVADAEGLTRQAASPETEEVSDNAGHGGPLGSAKKEDLDVFEDPTATCSDEVRNPKHSVLGILVDSSQLQPKAAKASFSEAKPSSFSRRSPSRSRKQPYPKRFIAGEAAAASPKAPVLDMFLTSLVKDPLWEMKITAHQLFEGSFRIRDVKHYVAHLRQRRSAGGPSSPVLPLESAASSGELTEGLTRRAASTEPEDFSATANAGHSAASGSAEKEGLDVFENPTAICSGEVASPKGSRDSSEHKHPPELEGMATKESSNDGKSCTVATDATSSSFSGHSPSGSRKQPHSTRFVVEEVKADQRFSVEGFRLKDVNHYVARLRDIQAASDSSCSASPGSTLPSAAETGPPEDPDESCVGSVSLLIVLGAALACVVVSCTLRYFFGQSTEPDPSGKKQKK